MNPFTWLRIKVRDACLAGIGDAIEIIDNENGDAGILGRVVLPPQLAARLAALPAPQQTDDDGTEPVSAKRKGKVAP